MLAMTTVSVGFAQDTRTSQAHQALFYRLNAPRQPLPDGSQKSVGGLTCSIKSKPGGPGTLFNCVLTDAPDAAAIYEALNMQGKKMPGAGSLVYSKTSGLLTCTRTERGQDVSYACGWKSPDSQPTPKAAAGSSGSAAAPPSDKAAASTTTPADTPAARRPATASAESCFLWRRSVRSRYSKRVPVAVEQPVLYTSPFRR